MKNTKNTNKKLLIVSIIALMLAVACVVGTFAYLSAKTKTVVNTFTTSNITLTINEVGATPNDENADILERSYKIYPGAELDKKATITVGQNSEDCWVFVKLVKSANFDTTNVFECSMNTVWTLVPGQTDVYYAEIPANKVENGILTEKVSFGILAGDKVVIKDTATAAQMSTATGSTLSFVGYAIQKDVATTAEAAWTEASQLG